MTEPRRQHERRPTFEDDEDLAGVMKGHGPCTYLLLSLLALILVYPYLMHGVFGRVALGILYSLVLLCGAYAIGEHRWLMMFKVPLAALGIALQWTALLTGHPAAMQLTALTYAVFLALMISEVLRYIMKRGPVTADKLHGALAGYIMLAFLWAFIYALTESLRPGSFTPRSGSCRRLRSSACSISALRR